MATTKMLKIRTASVHRAFEFFFDSADYDRLVGRTFYVVECEYQRGSTGSGTAYELRDEPGRTNMSHEPRLHGWLGTTDNVYRYALGRYEVVGRSRTHLHLREVA